MPELAVVIPWRPTPDRLRARDCVDAWWRQEFGIEPIYVDGPAERSFNLAAARNEGFRQADADVVVACDADTVPEVGPILQATTFARSGAVVFPYARYHYLGDADPVMAMYDLPACPVERTYRNSWGGIFVATPETYWAVGGQDERFRQWGYEDDGFRLAAQVLAKVVRTEGSVYSFGHSGDHRVMGPENPGAHRAALYRFARTDARVMRELIIGNHGGQDAAGYRSDGSRHPAGAGTPAG